MVFFLIIVPVAVGDDDQDWYPTAPQGLHTYVINQANEMCVIKHASPLPMHFPFSPSLPLAFQFPALVWLHNNNAPTMQSVLASGGCKQSLSLINTIRFALCRCRKRFISGGLNHKISLGTNI